MQPASKLLSIIVLMLSGTKLTQVYAHEITYFSKTPSSTTPPPHTATT